MILNNLEVLRPQWDNIKCNPKYFLFAGFINKPTDGTGYFDAAAKNFQGCSYQSLKYVTGLAFNPTQYIVSAVSEVFASMIRAGESINKLFKELLEVLIAFIKNILAGVFDFAIKLRGLFLLIMDTMKKISGILTTGIYALFGSYMTLKTLFLIIIDFIILILTIICGMVIPLVYIYDLPFGLGIWIGPLIDIIIGIYSLIFYPLVWFLTMIENVTDLHPNHPPNIPGCFVGDTPIELASVNEVKNISDIAVGDKLKNGSIVTCVIQFAAQDQHMYKLHNVFVTGEHRVFHPTLKWVKVKNHPDSIYLPHLKPDIVYCLNTTLKEFTIHDTIFSDWDDIDEEVIAALNKNCVEKGYLPKGFTYADIHSKLDSGFTSDTLIKRKDGSEVEIKDVKLNEVLNDNSVVLGLIKIAAHDLPLYQYTFEDKLICGSKNIHVNDPTIGLINAMDVKDSILVGSEPYIYHLLTTTGSFYANNIKMNDYNFGIDTYLHM